MTECPCGSGTGFATCCGPLVADGVPAATAEQLMRSRYTAFVFGSEEHLWRTWHPRTRPSTVEVDDVDWTGLTILDVVSGGVDDATGAVEFEAAFRGPDGPSSIRERSTFERRGGRWVYLEGEVTRPSGRPAGG